MPSSSYLVIIRPFDDCSPLGLFATQEEADQAADWYNAKHGDRPYSSHAETDEVRHFSSLEEFIKATDV